ncbi:MAG: hypothetical protein JST12_05565 [Armatimonadetes bacterium]|nr:hypothetical protein [Armatimonadota bacterium]
MGKRLADLGIALLAAIATGTLLCLALPLGEQSYLAWIMLIPLLLATREKGLLVGFLSGLAAIFWCAFLATTGVFYSFKHDAPAAWTYTACGIFAASFSLFFGIYAEGKNHERPVIWLGCLAVVLESLLLFQIPAHLALTQYRNWLMMLIASIGGVWMISFLVWSANIYLSREIKKRLPIALAIVAASFVTSKMHPFGHEAATGLTVGAAQITDGLDHELVAAHLDASQAKPAFVVWPEFAGMLFVFGDDTSKLKQISTKGAPLITSFRDTAQPLPHNVAAMFFHGQESNRYEKRKLFGSETKMHAPGNKPVEVPLVGQPGQVALNICYDSCFPAIIRESANQPEVRVVALPTIDPDSAHYFMAAMHAAYTPIRAAESGIAIVRADGNFGSMIVDERGGIVKEMSDKQGPMTAMIKGKRIWTLDRTFGDWFLYLSILFTLFHVATRLRDTQEAKRAHTAQPTGAT